MMKGTIELEGMEFFARHGCMEHEKVAGNRFLVDFRAGASLDKAAQTDALEDTLNYGDIYKLVAREMAGSQMMYMPIINCLQPGGKKLFKEYEGWYAETGEKPLAYEVCFDKLNDEAVDCCKKVVAQGSKLWVNTLWASLCGGYDDDAAYNGDPDEIYGKILSLGTSMIQTDRPEFLINWLKKQGRRK